MARSHRRTLRTYTMEEKVALVSEIERRYRAGEGTLGSIARSLGTSDTSYHNWVRAGIGATPAPAPVMRPVEVTALVPVAPSTLSLVAPHVASVTETLTLVSPSGYRVEGLAIESAAALLRALA